MSKYVEERDSREEYEEGQEQKYGVWMREYEFWNKEPERIREELAWYDRLEAHYAESHQGKSRGLSAQSGWHTPESWEEEKAQALPRARAARAKLEARLTDPDAEWRQKRDHAADVLRSAFGADVNA